MFGGAGVQATRIYNFSFGSIKITKDITQFTISRREFTYDHLDEIVPFLENRPSGHFLPFQQAEETNGHVVLKFDSVAHLKPIAAIQREAYVVKLSIAQALLDDEIVTKETNFVSLHPATIFYHPMSTVRYAYRANRLMPREEIYTTHLRRYKALVLMILTGQPYETCLKEPEHLEKQGNALIGSILQAQTIEDMQALVTEAHGFIAYETVQAQIAEKKKWQRGTFVGVLTTVLLAFSVVGYVKYDANEDQRIALQKMKGTYEAKALNTKAEMLFQEAHYAEAIPLFEDLGISSENVAKRLIAKEQWQLALDTEPALLEAVIAALYEKGEEKEILELTLSDAKETLVQKLAQEQAIVSYDVAQMTAELAFISDANTLKRMGLAFVENGNMAGARDVVAKTQDATLQTAIDVAQAENELTVAKEKMATIQKTDSKKRNDQLKLQQSKITELEAKIKALKED